MESVLKTYRKSKLVFEKYFTEFKKTQFYRPLFKRERRIVVGAITDWMIFKGILLRRSDYPRIVGKIQKVFPREAGFVYYSPPRTVITENEEVEKEKIPDNENTPENVNESMTNNKKSAQSKKRKMKNKGDLVVTKTPPSGLLYSAFRHRITKARKEAKEMEQCSDSFYR